MRVVIETPNYFHKQIDKQNTFVYIEYYTK
jgi:hypothetical protein